jgi:hypothetical protein
MSRLERPQATSLNPANKFFNWKSEEKLFTYWDKEKEQNVQVQLPLKVLFMEHYHTVKGWHGATDKGIVSNEVYGLSKDFLKVRTFGGLEIAEGLYKDIKDRVKLAGGVYYRSVYVMLENGSLANLQLKGAVLGGLKSEQSLSKKDVDGYSEFYNKNNRLLDNQWILIDEVAEAKKGATKYSIPVFKLGEVISREANDQANKCATALQDYVNQYLGKKNNTENLEVEIEEDGLDF